MTINSNPEIVRNSSSPKGNKNVAKLFVDAPIYYFSRVNSFNLERAFLCQQFQFNNGANINWNYAVSVHSPVSPVCTVWEWHIRLVFARNKKNREARNVSALERGTISLLSVTNGPRADREARDLHFMSPPLRTFDRFLWVKSSNGRMMHFVYLIKKWKSERINICAINLPAAWWFTARRCAVVSCLRNAISKMMEIAGVWNEDAVS